VNYATGNTYAFVSMAMLAANNRIQLEAIRYKSEPDAMADLPPDIVATMNKAVAAALAKPTVREQMQKHGFTPRSPSPTDVAAYMKDQLAAWKAALNDAGIEPQ
jgi:tripartite-type tricarboxylate transporter receptor subunit TctC